MADNKVGRSFTRREFTLGKAHTSSRSFGAMCFRHAVLYPLFPATPRQYETNQFIREASERLIVLRRRRFAELRKLGAPPLTSRSYAFTENCPPWGIGAREREKPCGLSYLCPFCWGRDVIQPVMRQLLLCFPTVPGPGKGQPPLFLTAEMWPLQDHKTQLLRSEAGIVVASRDLREYLRREAACNRTSLQSRRKWQKFLGSVVTVSATPPDPGDSWWRLWRRRLTLVPPGVDDPGITPCHSEFPDNSPTLLTCDHSAQLIDAVAKTLRYPDWLLRGDPEQAATFLRARKGLRLLHKCGKLRQSH